MLTWLLDLGLTPDISLPFSYSSPNRNATQTTHICKMLTWLLDLGLTPDISLPFSYSSPNRNATQTEMGEGV